MSRWFNRVTGWIVTRPVVSLALLLSLSGLALGGYIDPDWISKLLFPPPPATSPADTRPTPDRTSSQRLPNVEPVQLTSADAILVVESDDVFTPAGARALRQIVNDLEALDHVRDVLWMDRVPILNIFGLPEPLFPRAESTAQRFLAAREKALRHPLVAGQLLSSDGRTLLMMVRFNWLYVASDEDCTSRLREVAEAAAARHPKVQFSFLVTGRVPMFLAAVASHEENQLRYQLIGYGMILLMSVILFRGVAAVLVVALAPSLGVFWTLGLLSYFDLAENPFNDVILPVLLSLVGLTDGVHLMVQIRRNRVSGMTSRSAAAKGIQDVGLACALTSLTTAIGFGSLTLAHHEVVREFGMCCVFGVILTFISVVVTIPLACTTWLGRWIHVGHDKSLIDRHLNRIGVVVQWVLGRTRTMSLIAIVTTIALTGLSLTLRPDERNSNALPEGSEAAKGLAHIDRALGGLEFGRVDVVWSDQVESESPQILEVMGRVDRLLRSEPLIGHPLSIHNLIEALPGEGKPAERMSMLDLLPPPLKRAFYTPERRHAATTFRVQDLGIATYGPAFERIESGLTDLAREYPQFQFELAGSAVWRWQNLYQIVVDLASSLGSAMVVIFVVLAIVYRSLRIGLIAIVPNLFPLAATAAFLVVTGQALELVSVCAFTVCLGIAVDDTIHFLTRYQEEQNRSDDPEAAIRRAFVAVGTALIMTTIVLVAGFSTVLFSDSRDHRLFATMGTLTIGSALFGDLVFLPALLARFARRRTSSGQASDQGGPAS